MPVPPEEKERRRKARRAARPVSPWIGLIFPHHLPGPYRRAAGHRPGRAATAAVPTTFLCLMGVMWAYFMFLRSVRRVGFEMETIAFFLSTLSLWR